MYKKITVFSLILLVLASSIVAVSSAEPVAQAVLPGSLPGTAWNGFLTIYPNGSLSDINAPVVQNGDTYTLTGNINGTLTVQHSGAIIDGNGYTIWNNKAMPPVTLSDANGILVENMIIYSWYAAGINIVASSYDTISNNTIYAMVTGIFVFSPFNTITYNTVNVSLTDPEYSGISVGIMVKATYTNISDNEVIMGEVGNAIVIDSGLSSVNSNVISFTGQSSQGIVSSGVSNQFRSNQISGSGSETVGINLLPGSQSSVVSYNSLDISGEWVTGISIQDSLNTINSNTVTVSGSYNYAIQVLSAGTSPNTISWNILNGNGVNSLGINDLSQNTGILNNSITVAGTYSMGIYAINYTEISGNAVNVTGNLSRGISSPLGNISHNIVSANGSYVYGIYSSGGQYDNIIGNIVSSTGYHSYGVQLDGQFQLFSDNIVTAGYNSGIGFMAGALSDSVISDNNISGSSTGIQSTSYSSTNDTFFGNFLYSDTIVFKLAGVASNIYYHNDFVNYTSYQITGSRENVTWDNGYPSGGNYWFSLVGHDNYSGVHQNITGSDGIFDAQFNVSGSNIDHYPLAKTWERPQAIFHESGLATNTAWAVNFSGKLIASSEDSIYVGIPNAAYMSYLFEIQPISGYTLSLSSGSAQYNGSDIIIDVVFTAVPPPTYIVSFTESGLPTGTLWSLALGDTSMTTTLESVSFSVSNGTYPFTVFPVPGYSTSDGSGNVVVNGSGVSLAVDFTQVTYTVTFTEAGLLPGMTWYINLSSGQSLSTTGAFITFYLPNGTYSFTVSKVPDFNSTPSSGSFVISGSSPGQFQITFQKNESIPPAIQPGNTFPWIYVITIVIVAAVAGAISAVIYYERKK